MSSTPEQPERESLGWRSPTILAALIAAAGAVLVALITLAGNAVSRNDPPTPTPSVVVQPPAPALDDSNTTSPDGPDPVSPPAETASVRFAGPVRLGGQGLDLDALPDRSSDPSNLGLDVQLVTLSLDGPPTIMASRGAAIWTSGGTPTYAQCAQLLGTQKLSELEAMSIKTNGAALCIATSGGSTAFLHVTGKPPSAFGGSVAGDLVVWATG